MELVDVEPVVSVGVGVDVPVLGVVAEKLLKMEVPLEGVFGGVTGAWSGAAIAIEDSNRVIM